MTDAKRAHFYKRTATHIGRVKRNADILAAHYPDIAAKLLIQVDKHDASKYLEPELEPYIEITWDYKCKRDNVPNEMSPDIKEAANEATLHHIRSNKHHPEYWDPNFDPNQLNRNDRDAVPDVMVDGRQMNEVSIAEMCADWVSMAQEKMNSNSAHAWAKMNINKRWQFSPWQIKSIYEFLDKLQEVLDGP